MVSPDEKYIAVMTDDLMVAQDKQHGLKSAYGNLHIGAGKDLATGTFWSGLIDDVRIYQRVIQP